MRKYLFAPSGHELTFAAFFLNLPKLFAFDVEPFPIAAAVKAERGVVKENKLFPEGQWLLNALLDEIKCR